MKDSSNNTIVKQYYIVTYPIGGGVVLHDIIINLVRTESGENMSYVSDGRDPSGKFLEREDDFYPPGNVNFWLDKDKNDYWWKRFNWDYYWIRDGE
jgi:hypothetical protein